MDTYVEKEIDVADENDEPIEDGLYTDEEGEHWLRLEGLWQYVEDDIAFDSIDWDSWEDRAIMYVPFTKVSVWEGNK